MMVVQRRFIGVLVVVVVAVCLHILVRNYNNETMLYTATSEERKRSKETYLAQLNSSGASSGKRRRPNLMLIVADDLGWGDVGYHHQHQQGPPSLHFKNTPNIDALAMEAGVHFVDFSAGASVCTPSRAALMTGRYAPRTGIGDAVLFPPKHPVSLVLHHLLGRPPGLLEDEITIAEVLSRLAYRTSLIGKWHCGSHAPHAPNDFGFEHFFGSLYSNDMSPFALYENREISVPMQTESDQRDLTTRYTQAVVDRIDDAASKDQPFFIYYAPNAPHDPLYARPRNPPSRCGLYGDVVGDLDDSIGVIRQTLIEQAIDEDTAIFFTSDNGPWFEGSTGPFRGRKASSGFEGGFRVPFVVSYPAAGWIGGRAFHEPVHATDLFPTLLALAGAPSLPHDRVIDGVDLGPLLSGETTTIDRLLPVFSRNALVAARFGRRWKIHRQHLVETSELIRSRFLGQHQDAHGGEAGGGGASTSWMWLVDLEFDPSESVDCTRAHPDLAATLARRANEWANAFEQDPRWGNYSYSAPPSECVVDVVATE